MSSCGTPPRRCHRDGMRVAWRSFKGTVSLCQRVKVGFREALFKSTRPSSPCCSVSFFLFILFGTDSIPFLSCFFLMMSFPSPLNVRCELSENIRSDDIGPIAFQQADL